MISILKDKRIINSSVITEHTISYEGQDKKVERAARKWIKARGIGKVQYNPKTDITFIIWRE